MMLVSKKYLHGFLTFLFFNTKTPRRLIFSGTAAMGRIENIPSLSIIHIKQNIYFACFLLFFFSVQRCVDFRVFQAHLLCNGDYGKHPFSQYHPHSTKDLQYTSKDLQECYNTGKLRILTWLSFFSVQRCLDF